MLFIGNPQNLNTYSYALNNPVRYTDPDGKQAVEAKTFLQTFGAFAMPAIEITGGVLVGIIASPLLLLSGDTPQTPKQVEGEIAASGGIGKSMSQDLNDLAGGSGTMGPGGQGPEDDEWSKVSKPNVKNKELKNAMDELYRPGAKIGNGSTADAIRYELRTENLIHGKSNLQKGKDFIKFLEKWTKNNPNAPAGDKQGAKKVLNDLKNALK